MAADLRQNVSQSHMTHSHTLRVALPNVAQALYPTAAGSSCAGVKAQLSCDADIGSNSGV